MDLKLYPPAPSLAQLRAWAASGSSRYARKAQAALRERVNAELRKALQQPTTGG